MRPPSRFARERTELLGVTDDTAFVEYRTDDGWIARWVLVEQNGSVVARGLVLEPASTTPVGGITTNLLRELHPNEAVALSAEARSLEDDFASLLIKGRRRDGAEPGPVRGAPRKPGRPSLSDETLAAVAAAYLDELQAGRGVLKRLGVRFDRSPETMRDRVRLARMRGFLGPAPQSGRRGGTPGPRLLELLDHAQAERGSGDG